MHRKMEHSRPGSRMGGLLLCFFTSRQAKRCCVQVRPELSLLLWALCRRFEGTASSTGGAWMATQTWRTAEGGGRERQS